MKALILGCNSASFENCIAAVEMAEGLRIGSKTQVDSGLVILLTVETSDIGRSSTAAKALRRSIKRSDYDTVILNLFAHLSSDLAPLEQALQFQSDLLTLLRQQLPMHRIEFTDFGFRKHIVLDIKEGQDDQRFVSI